PEDASDGSCQIVLGRGRDHRACVPGCGDGHLIDFEGGATARGLDFDLVRDLRDECAFAQHQPPQGYFHPGADAAARARALIDLAQATGEFEKPKYFVYKESICAHSRSKKTGCTQCIDVCSTAAIASDGDRIRVEPHLCMGCGACA